MPIGDDRGQPCPRATTILLVCDGLGSTAVTGPPPKSYDFNSGVIGGSG